MRHRLIVPVLTACGVIVIAMFGQQPLIQPPGPVNVIVDGNMIGTATTVKFISGTGVLLAGTPPSTTGEVDITVSANTAKVVSWDDVLAAGYCPATLGTILFTCELQIPPAGYKAGMIVQLAADVACQANTCSLSIHNLQALTILTNDITNSPATFGVGIHLLSYDANVNVWRLLL